MSPLTFLVGFVLIFLSIINYERESFGRGLLGVTHTSPDQNSINLLSSLFGPMCILTFSTGVLSTTPVSRFFGSEVVLAEFAIKTP